MTDISKPEELLFEALTPLDFTVRVSLILLDFDSKHQTPGNGWLGEFCKRDLGEARRD